MDSERGQEIARIMQEAVNGVLAQAPELKDTVIVFNWDKAEATENTSVPGSIIMSNRKDNTELHMQGAELCRLLSDSVISVSERTLDTLIKINAQMFKDLQEAEAKLN